MSKREAERLAVEALAQNGDAVRPYQVEAVIEAMIAFGTRIEREALERAAQIAEGRMWHPELYGNRYRTWDWWPPESNIENAGALACLADEIAAAIRALIREE